MKSLCPKCGWTVFNADKEVYARKQNGGVVLIKLHSAICNRQGCDWGYRENYQEKIKELGLKKY